MEYKGYIGSVEFSEEDGIFFGKVMGIRSLISYEGTGAKSLVEDFRGARFLIFWVIFESCLWQYMKMCAAVDKTTETQARVCLTKKRNGKMIY